MARARTDIQRWTDPDWELVAGRMDVLHYLLQAPNVFAHPGADPVRHFFLHGSPIGRSPDPHFSFDRYAAAHAGGAGEEIPDAAAAYVRWLRAVPEARELADPAPGIEFQAPSLGRSVPEAVDLVVARRQDLIERFRGGELGEMLAKAAEIEPMVGDAWTETTAPRIQPFVSEAVSRAVGALHTAQQQADHRRARLVLVIANPRWGGGRRMEGHLAHALTRAIDPDDIVVIYTEAGGEAPKGRFPDGVREIDFAAAVADLESDQRERVLVELVRSLRADAVVNINSVTFYAALATYGRALSASERVFLLFFCNEQMVRGNWKGLPLRQFYRNVDRVAGVLTDSAYLVEWFQRQYLIDAETRARLHVLRAPVDPGLTLASRPEAGPDRRPKVLWAGRWDRQKRVDLAMEIARRMPDLDFVMYGEAVLDGDGLSLTPPENVTAPGSYDHITSLDLGEADVWLYTSGWDGVPSQLLEVAMTGVPIVATDVGGTREVLGSDDSWLVPADADAAPYVAAIREAIADPDAAARRGRMLRERMLEERTEEEFAAFAAALLLRPTEESR